MWGGRELWQEEEEEEEEGHKVLSLSAGLKMAASGRHTLARTRSSLTPRPASVGEEGAGRGGETELGKLGGRVGKRN